MRRVLSPRDGRRARKAACRLYPLQRAKTEAMRFCVASVFLFRDSNPERVSEFKSRVLHVHFTVAKHGFVLFVFFNQLIKQRSAAVKDIFVCHFKISRIPRVGNISATGGIIHEFMYLSVGVIAKDIKHISYVCTVHANEQIVLAVVVFLKLNRPLAVTFKSVLCKLGSCWRINGIADSVPNLDRKSVV